MCVCMCVCDRPFDRNALQLHVHSLVWRTLSSATLTAVLTSYPAPHDARPAEWFAPASCCQENGEGGVGEGISMLASWRGWIGPPPRHLHPPPPLATASPSPRPLATPQSFSPHFCEARRRAAVRGSVRRPALARLQLPSCAAAVIFTAKGASRVLGLARPVWAGIDQPHLQRRTRGCPPPLPPATAAAPPPPLSSSSLRRLPTAAPCTHTPCSPAASHSCTEMGQAGATAPSRSVSQGRRAKAGATAEKGQKGVPRADL